MYCNISFGMQNGRNPYLTANHSAHTITHLDADKTTNQRTDFSSVVSPVCPTVLEKTYVSTVTTPDEDPNCATNSDANVQAIFSAISVSIDSSAHRADDTAH